MKEAKVLFLSTDNGESAVLEKLLSEYVVLRKLLHLSELQNELQDGNYDAMFCEWSFHRGTWREVLQQIQHRCPDMPLIVFSRTGGEREWLDVLEAGSFDLLVPPYNRHAVLPVLEHAISSHNARIFQNVTPASAAMTG